MLVKLTPSSHQQFLDLCHSMSISYIFLQSKIKPENEFSFVINLLDIKILFNDMNEKNIMNKVTHFELYYFLKCVGD